MRALDTALKIAEWKESPVQFFRDVAKQEPVEGQRRLLESMKGIDENRILLCCASGAGKTRVLGAAALLFVVTRSYAENKPIQVIIISGFKDQSRVLYDYTKEYIGNSPIIMDMIEEKLRTETRFKNGSYIKALPCSTTAFYGKHVELLIIDEAAMEEIPEVIIDHAFSIIAPVKNSKLVMSSTPYVATGKFADLWENAENWTKIHWEAKDCPWFDKVDIEEARERLSAEEFSIRWEGKIVVGEDNLIRHSALKECIIETLPRQSLEPISFGLDWGWVHPTVLTVTQRESEDYNLLASRAWKKARMDYLFDQIYSLWKQYKPYAIYADSSHHFNNMKLMEMGLPVIPVKFKKEKEFMIQNLVSLIEHNKLHIHEDEIDVIQQLKKFKRGMKKNDDFVDSLMLAIKEGVQGRVQPTYHKIVEYE